MEPTTSPTPAPTPAPSPAPAPTPAPKAPVAPAPKPVAPAPRPAPITKPVTPAIQPAPVKMSTPTSQSNVTHQGTTIAPSKPVTPAPTPASAPAPSPAPAPAPAPKPAAPALAPTPAPAPKPVAPAPKPVAPAPKPVVPAPTPAPAPAPEAPAPTPEEPPVEESPAEEPPVEESLSTSEALENALKETGTVVTPIDAPTEPIAPKKRKGQIPLLIGIIVLLAAAAVGTLYALGIINFGSPAPEPPKEDPGPTVSTFQSVCSNRNMHYEELDTINGLYESYKAIFGEDTESIHHCITAEETIGEDPTEEDSTKEFITVFFNGNYRDLDAAKRNDIIGSYVDAYNRGNGNVTILENGTDMFKEITVAGPSYTYVIVYKNTFTYMKINQIDTAESIIRDLGYPVRNPASIERIEQTALNAEADAASLNALNSFSTHFDSYIAANQKLPNISGETQQLNIDGTGTTDLDYFYQNNLFGITTQTGEHYAFQASIKADETLAKSKIVTIHYSSRCNQDTDKLETFEGETNYALTYASADGERYLCVSK